MYLLGVIVDRDAISALVRTESEVVVEVEFEVPDRILADIVASRMAQPRDEVRERLKSSRLNAEVKVTERCWGSTAN